jgi:hypothetical protein
VLPAGDSTESNVRGFGRQNGNEAAARPKAELTEAMVDVMPTIQAEMMKARARANQSTLNK